MLRIMVNFFLLLFFNPMGYYNMACVNSLKKELQKACAYLHKAITKGYNNWENIKTDITLDNLRKTDCYKRILEVKGKD